MTELNPSPTRLGDLDAMDRFALALAASLALHLALILGVQIKATQQSGKAQSAMEVRIARQTGEVSSVALSNGESSVVQVANESETVEPAHDQQEVPPPAMPASPAIEQTNPLLPALEVPLLEDPTWYPAKQLDVHPTALHEINLDKPGKSDGREVEGYGILLVMIDEAGVVREVSKVEENPEGFIEEYQLSAFREARFAPGQKNGRAVKSRFLVRMYSDLSSQKKPVVVQPPLPLTP